MQQVKQTSGNEKKSDIDPVAAWHTLKRHRRAKKSENWFWLASLLMGHYRGIIAAQLLHRSKQRLNNRRNFLIATHVCLLIWAEHTRRLILHNDRAWKSSQDLLQFLLWLRNKTRNHTQFHWTWTCNRIFLDKKPTRPKAEQEKNFTLWRH